MKDDDAWTATGAAVAGVLLFLLLLLATRNRQTDLRAPPWARSGTLETLLGLASPEAPRFLLREARVVGPVFRLRIPFRSIVVVGDAAAARAVLGAGAAEKAPEVYAIIDRITHGQSVMTKSHREAHIARRVVSHAFTKEHVERMRDICVRRAREYAEAELRPLCDRDEGFDLCEHMLQLTLTVLLEAGFGYESTREERAELLEAMELAVGEYGGKQISMPFRKHLWWCLPAVSEAYYASCRLLQFGQKLLDLQRAGALGGGETVLSRIACDAAYQTEEARRAEVVIYLFGGHDTTAFSLGWLLYELASRPDMAGELREELNGAEAPVKSAGLHAVIRESHRLHAVAPLGPVRKLTQPLPLPSCGDRPVVELPAGTLCIVPFYVIHRSLDVFVQPDDFRPARWLEANWRTGEAMAAALMPFSLGRRSCIGQALAAAELSVIVMELVTRFRFQVVQAPTMHVRITMRPRGARLRVSSVIVT